MTNSNVAMVNLAFTFIKKVAPHIHYISLDDKSDFTCIIGERTVGISMMLYELALHEKSYYEKLFGAYLENPILRDLYKKGKSGFLKPLPPDFSFNNESLEEILKPIYKESKNWREFFEKCKDLPNLCKILFPWYRQAMMIIFDGISFERQRWIIDLDSRPTISVEVQSGGRRISKRKTRNYDIYFDMPLYEEIYKMKLI